MICGVEKRRGSNNFNDDVDRKLVALEDML